MNGFGKFPYILKVAKYLKSSEISLKVSESVVRSVKVSKSSKKFRNILTGYKRLIMVKFRKVPKSSENLQTAKVWFLPKNSKVPKVPKIPNIKVHLISTKYNGQTKKYSEINFILRNKKSSETLKNHASLEITFLFIMFPLTRNVWEPKSPITKRVVWSIFIHLCIPNLFWLDD